MLGAAVGVALGQALPFGAAGAALGAGLLGGAAVIAFRPRTTLPEAPPAATATTAQIPPPLAQPAPMAPADAPPAIDGNRFLEQIAGDMDLLKELADIFDGECPARLAALDAAVAAGTPEHVWPAAHALKGMFATIYAEEARSVAARIEASARAGRLAEVTSELPRLTRSARAAGTDLRRLAERGAS